MNPDSGEESGTSQGGYRRLGRGLCSARRSGPAFVFFFLWYFSISRTCIFVRGRRSQILILCHTCKMFFVEWRVDLPFFLTGVDIVLMRLRFVSCRLDTFQVSVVDFLDSRCAFILSYFHIRRHFILTALKLFVLSAENCCAHGRRVNFHRHFHVHVGNCLPNSLDFLDDSWSINVWRLHFSTMFRLVVFFRLCFRRWVILTRWPV